MSIVMFFLNFFITTVNNVRFEAALFNRSVIITMITTRRTSEILFAAKGRKNNNNAGVYSPERIRLRRVQRILRRGFSVIVRRASPCRRATRDCFVCPSPLIIQVFLTYTHTHWLIHTHTHFEKRKIIYCI